MAIVSSITNHSSLPNDKGEERLVGSNLLKEELKLSKQDSLRPKSFDEFIGQSDLKVLMLILFFLNLFLIFRFLYDVQEVF